jgi:hypothetical protein
LFIVFLLFSFTFRTKTLFQARDTTRLGTVLAAAQAVRTGSLLADRAGSQAGQTARGIAAVTIAGTLVAERIATKLTAIEIVLVCNATTVITGRTVPLVERDIGVAGVVGRQDIPDQCEKVTQSPLLQGRPDGGMAVAFAEAVVTDVRMGNRIVAGRRVRIRGHDHVR